MNKSTSRIAAVWLLALSSLACGDSRPQAQVGHQPPDPVSAEERAQMTKELDGEIAACNAALLKDPASITRFSRRGDAQLFLGEPEEAVKDFEKMIALDPAQEAPHWRLGIAYYLAGDFAKSERQFVKYHIYDNGDRENGIWKFLAQAHHDKLEKARSEMLVYADFDREPFPELYEMFAGKRTAEEVFAEIAQKGLADDEHVMFFASYYAGLNEELLGRHDNALSLLRQAVSATSVRQDYMWQVARLQWERLSHAAGN
jgi:lipoprotein NlpI